MEVTSHRCSEQQRNSEDFQPSSHYYDVLAKQVELLSTSRSCQIGDENRSRMDFLNLCSDLIENDIILIEILNNVGPNDLKTFRLVNQRWNVLVTSMLLRKSLLQIQIRYYPRREMYFVENGQELFHPSFSLEKLSEYMRNSSRFPCASFDFKSRTSWAEENCLKEFLRSHGTTLRNLRLWSITSFCELKFLLENAPGLDHLAIVYLNVGDCEEEALRTTLKSVHVRFMKESDVNQKVFKKLLQSSPYLQKIQDFEIDHFKILQDIEKLYLIQSLKFNPDSENLMLYKEFAMQNVHLTELNVSVIAPQDSHNLYQTSLILSAILNNSANTLKKLTMIPLGDWNVQFPKLPNLQKICYIENDEYMRTYSPEVHSDCVFPNGFDFSGKFPTIGTVCFKGIGDRDIASFFPQKNSQEVIRVKDLKISTIVSPGEIYFLTSKLLVMTSLELRHTHLNSSEVNLWALLPKSIRTLRLFDTTFFISPQSDEKMGLLDYYFTRIISNTKLEKYMTPQGRIFHIRNTEEPSLLKMTHLRSLDFTFELLGSYRNLTWFTALSGKYAFQPLEDLRVTLYYDKIIDIKTNSIKEKLESLSEFATISHFNRRRTNEDHY